MTSRPILSIAAMSIVALSIVLVACGGGDSEGADITPPEITLITSTTEVPLFQEGDGVIEPSTTDDAEDDDSISTVVESVVATAIETSEVSTTLASDAGAATTQPELVDPAPEDPAPTAVGGDFVLGSDGLGAVSFGTEPEQTITFLASVLGAPTADTGWLDPFEIGPCGGTRIRRVNWNQLQLEFGDASDVVEGRDHFYAYFYGAEGSAMPEPAGLKTAEQIGVGSSVASLLAAYPGATLFQGDEFIGPSFNINDNFTGRLSGTADDDVVEVVVGGLPCDG